MHVDPKMAFVILNHMIAFGCQQIGIDINRARGATFCHVSRTIMMVQLVLFATWGSHQWNGAIPILVVNAIRMSKEEAVWEWVLVYVMMDMMRIIEPVLWMRKYLIIASKDVCLFGEASSGIIAIRFNSKAIHRISQFVLDNVRIVEAANRHINIRFLGDHVWFIIGAKVGR